MQMFSKSPEVIEAGVSYLHCVLPFYFLLAIVFMFNSTLRGTGETIIPMISSFVALWFARVPIAYFIADHWGKNYLFLSYGFGWALGSLISGIYFATGRWKRKVWSITNKNHLMERKNRQPCGWRFCYAEKVCIPLHENDQFFLESTLPTHDRLQRNR